MCSILGINPGELKAGNIVTNSLARTPSDTAAALSAEPVQTPGQNTSDTADALSAEPVQTPGQNTPGGQGASVTASALNLRTSPWGSVEDVVLKGGTLEIIDSGDSKWLKVKYKGKELYAAKEFVNIESKAAADSSSNTIPTTAPSTALSTDPTTAPSTAPTRASTRESTTASAAASNKPAPPLANTSMSGFTSSPAGQKQLKDVAAYAAANHTGASRGMCFNAVWGYLTRSGYGNLKKWGDLPDMPSGEARNFAEFMNSSQPNLDRAGLKRIDTLKPPITNPHDSRIPVGAVIVVAAGSTGTRHATAGDIVIKGSNGRFINDGPNMYYGTKSSWKGKVLGVYIPK